MPSIDHETLVELFRNRPLLAPELISEVLGVHLPEHREVAVAESDFTQITPVPYRADLAVLLRSRGRNVHALVVEVQLARDEDKLYSWPCYASVGRARWRCDTSVLVVTPRTSVARWAARRRPIGLDNTFAPLVVGPEEVPEVVDFEAAASRPELAVLSAMAHGRRPSGGRIALAALAAARHLDTETATLYYDVILSSLGRAARSALEALMQSGHYEFKTEFARKYLERGREEGRVEGREEGIEQGLRRAVLKQLRLKFQQVPDAVVERVETAGVADLERWTERILVAGTLDEVFAE